MFNKIVPVLLILIINQLFSQTPSEPDSQLTVKISGFENNKGKVMIALSDSKEDYETKGKAFRTAVVEIIEQKAIFTFKNIAKGEYALKVFHDEDENGKLDTNFIGIPNEEYGFSNNVRGSFGPASWEVARFMFKSTMDTVHIVVD